MAQKKKMLGPLNDKQLTFVHAFIVDFNASAAYRKAYPDSSVESSQSSGSRLLSDARVQKTLKRLLTRRADAMSLTQESVLEAVSRLAFADTRQLVDPDTGRLRPLHELPEDVASSLSSFSLTEVDGEVRLANVRTSDKVRSLELLAKHLGILNDKHTHIHGHIVTFSPEVIATMSDAQLDRLEEAHLIISQLQREVGGEKRI
jgi:phage terminase small subunit